MRPVEQSPYTHVPKAPDLREIPELFRQFENDPDEHVIAARNHFFDAVQRRNQNTTDISYLRAFTAVVYHFHSNQKRFTGEPYVTHPLAAAALIAEDPYIPADQLVDHEIEALGHDLREIGLKRKYLKRFAGSEPTKGIERLSKIGRKKLKEVYYKKLLKGPLGSRRVKVADWIHNLRTTPQSYDGYPPDKWQRIDRFQAKFAQTAKFILPLIRSLPEEGEREYWYSILEQTFIGHKPIGMKDLVLEAL